ncbi:hypothetical protein H2202_010226 [Exophiala xenobiotica]|nr:hypothetical protein H2202_010226 [Exophiala xenobiotica]
MSPERLKATMPSPVILQHVAGTDITDTMVEEAAELFSRFYGVWGPLADQHLGSFAKQGRRVRMSAANLRRQILPDHGDNSYVRAMVGNELVGNVFATRYDIVSDGPSTSKVCWITQLCVDPRYRRQVNPNVRRGGNIDSQLDDSNDSSESRACRGGHMAGDFELTSRRYLGDFESLRWRTRDRRSRYSNSAEGAGGDAKLSSQLCQACQIARKLL